MNLARRRQWRRHVLNRDDGRCSDCGLDVLAILARWTSAQITDLANTSAACSFCGEEWPLERIEWPACWNCHALNTKRQRTPQTERNRVRAELLDLHFPRTLVMNMGAAPPLWEADHRVPLCEGGPDTLENLRTLCIPCHARWTSGLAARRAKLKAWRDRCETCNGGNVCIKHRTLTAK